MTDSHTFLPSGKPASIIYFWLIPIALDALFLIKEGISPENIIAAIFVFVLFSIGIIPYKKPVSIVVSTKEHTLLCAYGNCFGKIRSVTVDLNIAALSFKQRLLNLNYLVFGKGKIGWRILLYDGSYFNNRVVIKQDDELGYNKEQLDQIVALIKQIKTQYPL